MKTETVRARVSHELKQSSEEVLNELGMSVTEAIRLFLTQITLRQEFPLELKRPNTITLAAIDDTVTEESFNTVDDLFDEVLNDVKHQG